MTPTPPFGRWRAPLLYWLVLLLVVAAVSGTLSTSRVGRDYMSPPYHDLFLPLYRLQIGLFCAMLVALLALPLGRLRRRGAGFLASLGYALAYVVVIWTVLWGLIHAGFWLELSPLEVLGLIVQIASVPAVGVSPAAFYGLLLGAVLLIAGLSALTVALIGRIEPPTRDATAATLVLLFLLVHAPVRGYVHYYANQNQPAILALDDATPLALRTEALLPGLHSQREQLKNLESAERTGRWIEWARHRPAAVMPRRPNILWIVVESLRFDVLSEETTPYLWSHRAEFQLRLDRNHWSGGNATKFGLFSMFAGVGGYHLQRFSGQDVTFPFFSLLQENGYRIRIGKESMFRYGYLSVFLPEGTLAPRVGTIRQWDSDVQMVDSLLLDLPRRDGTPAFDVLMFDAPHWPYVYPAQDGVHQPTARELGPINIVRSLEEIHGAHNRFRNACHFVDRQIGRVLEAYRAAGALENTIVILTGDHGEEFTERGQVSHGGTISDYQSRVPLWIHFPPPVALPGGGDRLTTHLDLVATLLDYVGFREDILYTQGRSLLRTWPERQAIILPEQGYHFPYYHDVITPTFITRWRHGREAFLFSGVARRDGAPVTGDQWRREVERVYPDAAERYQVLPDVRRLAVRFQAADSTTLSAAKFR